MYCSCSVGPDWMHNWEWLWENRELSPKHPVMLLFFFPSWVSHRKIVWMRPWKLGLTHEVEVYWLTYLEICYETTNSSLKKDVFSFCHERGTKKKFWVLWGIEPQTIGCQILLFCLFFVFFLMFHDLNEKHFLQALIKRKEKPNRTRQTTKLSFASLFLLIFKRSLH